MSTNYYLDKEHNFYNYHTADVEGDDIFDIHKASNSYAQELLKNTQYSKEKENKYSQIVYMTPYEYFEACARDCFDEPTEQLIQSRRKDTYTIEHLKQVITVYKKKFPIPYIDYADEVRPSQEGLHRMMTAGDLFGWDKKFPVQIIRWFDEDRAKKAIERKHTREIEGYLQRAVNRSLRYKYYNEEELKDQLRSEFESEVRYLDEFENREFELELKDINEETLLVIIDNKYTCEIWKDDIQYLDKKELTDDDVEDIDLDDLSDWMKDLLTDLKKESVNEEFVRPEEFLVSNDLMNKLKNKFGKEYYKNPLCKDVCMYVKELCPKCDLLDFAIGVWKYENYEMQPISNKGHCVIRYEDKIYDYTSSQYDHYGITPSRKQPRVLIYNEQLSNSFGTEIYIDKDYAISVY